MKLDLVWLIGLIVMILIGMVGYFFRDLHAKLKDSLKEHTSLHDKVTKLEGKVERLDEKMPSEIANLEKVMDLKFQQLNQQFSLQFKELQKAIIHAEGTMNENGKAFIEFIKEMKK